MKKLTRIFTSILFIGLIIFSASCKKNNTPPELPPETSFAMDFDNFSTGAQRSADTTAANFAFAGVNVLVWNAILTVNLAVPVASFKKAFAYQGVWDKKANAYLWSYSFDAGLKTYTAVLHGKKKDATHTSWEMYISLKGGFSNVLWYSGTTANDKSTASWTLSKDGNNPTPYIQIDYVKNANGTANITYTSIEAGTKGIGSYITYGKTSSTPYNAYYNIYNNADGNLVNIEWNSVTREGHVKNPKHFSDSDWHCWTTLLKDVDCTN